MSTGAAVAPGGADRASRAVIGAIVFAVAVAAFSRVPLLPDIGADLSLTAGQVGLLTTAFGLGRLIMDLPAGRLADAIDPTLALAASGVALAFSAGLLAAAGSFAVAMFASGLIGCATAVTNTTGMYAFATATAARRRGASMALYIDRADVGPDGRARDRRSAGDARRLAGGDLGLGGDRGDRRRRLREDLGPGRAPTADLRRRRRRAPGGRRRAIRAGTREGRAAGAGSGSVRDLLRHRRADPDPDPVDRVGELGLSASAIGFAIGGAAAARFVSAWYAGVGSDRWSRKAVVVPMLVLMLVGALLLALPAGTWTWLASIFALAIGSSGISVAAAALADRVEPDRLGHELGVFRLLGDLGLLVGPAVSAFLYQEVDARSAALAAAAVFAIAVVTTLVWVRGTRGPSAAEPALAG